MENNCCIIALRQKMNEKRAIFGMFLIALKDSEAKVPSALVQEKWSCHWCCQNTELYHPAPPLRHNTGVCPQGSFSPVKLTLVLLPKEAWGLAGEAAFPNAFCLCLSWSQIPPHLSVGSKRGVPVARRQLP